MATQPSGQSCGNCQYYGSDGACHAVRPGANPSPSGAAYFPPMLSTQWCGSYRAAPWSGGTCSTCAFWINYQCQAGPPLAPSFGGQGYFQPTQAAQFCGNWRASAAPPGSTHVEATRIQSDHSGNLTWTFASPFTNPVVEATTEGVSGDYAVITSRSGTAVSLNTVSSYTWVDLTATEATE